MLVVAQLGTVAALSLPLGRTAGATEPAGRLAPKRAATAAISACCVSEGDTGKVGMTLTAGKSYRGATLLAGVAITAGAANNTGGAGGVVADCIAARGAR